MARAYKASRGRGVRRGSIPHTLGSNSPTGSVDSPTPVTPPTTLSGPHSASPTRDEVSPTQVESQASMGTDYGPDQNLPTQQRGPRGAYLNKNIPTKPSERTLIHIVDDSHYLEPVVARTITKNFKSNFYGKETQWNLLDENLVEVLYKSFKDRFQHESTVHPDQAREVWVEASKERCRGTWARVRNDCKEKTKSNKPSEWKECKPTFVTAEDWDGILKTWETEKWQKQSIAGAKNRKVVPGDEEGISSYVRHTGGSVSFATHLHRWEEKLGERPCEIKAYERLHKLNKGEGEWCDARSAKVSRMYDETVKTTNNVDSTSGLPFDPKAWLKVIGVPKKKNVYGFAETQEAEKILSHASSSRTKKPSFYNNEAIIESEVNARVEAIIESQVDARVESRIEKMKEELKEERRAEMEQIMKLFSDRQNATSSSE